MPKQRMYEVKQMKLQTFCDTEGFTFTGAELDRLGVEYYHSPEECLAQVGTVFEYGNLAFWYNDTTLVWSDTTAYAIESSIVITDKIWLTTHGLNRSMFA